MFFYWSKFCDVRDDIEQSERSLNVWQVALTGHINTRMGFSRPHIAGKNSVFGLLIWWIWNYRIFYQNIWLVSRYWNLVYVRNFPNITFWTFFPIGCGLRASAYHECKGALALFWSQAWYVTVFARIACIFHLLLPPRRNFCLWPHRVLSVGTTKQLMKYSGFEQPPLLLCIPGASETRTIRCSSRSFLHPCSSGPATFGRTSWSCTFVFQIRLQQKQQMVIGRQLCTLFDTNAQHWT